MRRILSTLLLVALPLALVRAEIDPNYYIYLCFGQSNMEGNAQAESIDEVVNSRFKMLATCKFDNPARSLGKWYTAKVPIVNPAGGLGPSDYFGRTLVAALPTGYKVGVVAVAMGGSPIEMFDKDKFQQKLDEHPDDWWAILAKQHYGGNPYQRLIDMGRKAQEVGVIKGILLHQGCSNNGDSQWPAMVKKIYNDMLTDLGLAADTVPLFVGETLREDQGGACWFHNTVVAKMPKTVPTSHVISSEGCPGNGKDPWHFSAMGYRMMGYRYAYEALKLMNRPLRKDEAFSMPNNLKRLFTVKQLTADVESELTLKKGRSKRINVTATFLDGHTENVTDSVHFLVPDFITVNGNLLKATEEGYGEVTITYTDFARTTSELTITINPNLSAISDLAADNSPSQPAASAIYNASGQRIPRLTRGLNIIKTGDHTQKVYMK